MCFSKQNSKKQTVKKILLSGMLCLIACMSCTKQPIKEEFVTSCDKSDFLYEIGKTISEDYGRYL